MINIKPDKIYELEEKLGITLTARQNVWEYRNAYFLNQDNEVIGLNLSRNRIVEINWLEKFDKLQKLDLSANQIIKINGLENLRHLQVLSLFDNSITEISGLDNLVELRELYLDANKITEIKGLETLKNLEKIDLNTNNITEINGLESLRQLKYLDLSRNEITEIKGLKNLKLLQKLSLWNNLIKDIKGLDNMTDLKYLYLSRNEISEILGLEKLKKLEVLHLSTNQITEIKGLENLTNLRTLQLSYNRIEKKSELYKLINIHSLEELRIDHNPVCDELKLDLIFVDKENHLLDIRNYFSANTGHGKQSLILPAKVALLGNHGTGKTSFLNYLKENKVHADKSTHILSIQQYNCSNYNSAHNYNLPYAIIYDFGGQDYYHGLYQAFLTDDSINMLFWCTNFENNLTRKDINGLETRNFTCDYWLSQIKYHNDRDKLSTENVAPILVIQSHADEHKRGNIRNHQYDIVNEFYVSLKEIDEFKQTNKNKADLEHIKAWLLDEIEKKRVVKDKAGYYVDFLKSIFDYGNVNEKYKHVAIQEILKYYKRPNDDKISKIEYLKSELTQLALRGLVLYYRKYKELEDVVWLYPSETVRYIQTEILSSNILKKGQISRDIFNKLCKDEKIKELLLKEMIIFFNKDTDEYIVPSYLPSITNEDCQIIGFDDKIDFVLRFDKFIPFGYFNRVICYFGNKYKTNKYWNDALIFIDDKKTRIFIKIDFALLEIKVSIDNVEVDNVELAKHILFILINLYWDEVFNTEWGETSEYASKIKDIPNDLYISLNGKIFIKYTELHEAQPGTTDLMAYEVDKKQMGINKEKAINDRIIKYKHLTNNKNIDPMKKIFISYSRKDIDYKNQLRESLNMLQIFNIADNWCCEDINIERWHDRIQKELQESDLIIYMLSVNFFNSNYILENEIRAGIEQISMNKNKKILCVIVSDFVDLHKLRSFIKNKPVNNIQKAIIELSDWQYLPYAKIKNRVTGNMEEKIIPLKRYPYIEEAYAQITQKVLDSLCK